jgi:hypothetical protein
LTPQGYGWWASTGSTPNFAKVENLRGNQNLPPFCLLRDVRKAVKRFFDFFRFVSFYCKAHPKALNAEDTTVRNMGGQHDLAGMKWFE